MSRNTARSYYGIAQYPRVRRQIVLLKVGAVAFIAFMMTGFVVSVLLLMKPTGYTPNR